MVSKEKVKKLADLARIEIHDKEAKELGKEMDAILDYVGQIKSITGNKEVSVPSPKQEESRDRVNIMREDENPTKPGTYSKELIDEFPDKKNNYLKVKKIL